MDNEETSILIPETKEMRNTLITTRDDVNLSKDKLETLTLGQTRVELEKLGLRTDYNAYLKSFKDKRNTMAHEFLANYVITQQILDGAALIHPFERELATATAELEQLIIFFDYINGAGDVNAWLEPKAP